MLNKRKAHVRTKRCPTRRLDEREERRIIRGLFGDQIVCLPCIVQKNLALVDQHVEQPQSGRRMHAFQVSVLGQKPVIRAKQRCLARAITKGGLFAV